MITVMIAEDQQMFRDFLVEKLNSEGIVAIGQASNGRELLDLLAREHRLPDIVLLDLEMPVMDGNQTLQEINRKYPELSVIILSSFTEGGLVNDFIAKGASGYVSKNSGIKVLIEEIRNTKHLYDYRNNKRKRKSIFTETELKLIPYILKGYTNKEIGAELGKAERTIEGHRVRLYEKTDTTNAAEFSKYCTKFGLDFLGDPNQN